jgi:hypothetical protein
MSDTMTASPAENGIESQTAQYENTTKNDLAIISAKYDRKNIIAALDNGTLCCLPDAKGFADTQAACNAINRNAYQGSWQLLLKDFQNRNGFPTAEFCTVDQIEKASGFAGKKIYIKQGAKGITLNCLIEGEPRSIRYFNIAQLHHPELVRAYADHCAQEREARLKEHYGENYHPQADTSKKPAVSCTSSEPDVYLGQYLAAVSEGRKFKASPELAEEFKQKTKDFIFARNFDGHINPFNLNRLGSRAKDQCKQFLSENRDTPKKERTRPSPRQADPDIGW